LVGSTGGIAALEGYLAIEPTASECVYRLIRSAERRQEHAEELRLRGTAAGSRHAKTLRLSVKPLDVAGFPSPQGLVLWRISDVTVENAKQAEERRIREATLAHYDAMPAGVLATDAEGRPARLNSTLAQWLGITQDDPQRAISDLRLEDIFAGDGAPLLRSMTRQHRGEAVTLALDIAAAGGVARAMQVIGRMAPGGESSGEITAVIHEPVSAGGTDPSSEHGFAHLYHSAPFGIATLDAEGRIASTNAAFARMFLDGAKAPLDRFADLFGHPDDREVRAALDAALASVGEGRSVDGPIEITAGAKREFTRRLYVSPLLQKNKSRGAVLYVIDATEQKELERQVAMIQKMDSVGALAGGIAHDFNNVLTAIIGFSDLLLERRRPTDPAYADIVNIKSNANRAAEMVKQLLAFARQQTLNPKVVSLNEVISDFSIMLSRYMTEKLELRTQHARDLWLVKADKGQFEQVLMNLVINARDAMPGGGLVTIRTRNVTERASAKLAPTGIPAGEYVLCEVSDTGTGMEPDVLAKIFEPFFTTKDVGKGTGLGLAQVYGIVKQTGGYITADSTPGVGTSFRIYLPRLVQTPAEIEAAAISREKEERKQDTRDLTGSGRVLLVEDEDAVRNFAGRALRRQGYEVIEAPGGPEALEAFNAIDGRVDIVVSDVIMPEMDGPTLLRELHKINPGLKVIFVSGYPDDAFRSNLEEGVGFAFLQKPFTLPQLAAKVKEELGR
jgi:two-component system cell cycle sensor histidine kinase/response regulator CckA